MAFEQRKTFSVEKKNERRSFKPKSWNHQDELKGLIGKQVIFNTTVFRGYQGTLLDADAYTIKVRLNMAMSQSVMTYFKANLESIGEI